jgi:hypothetical protein
MKLILDNTFKSGSVLYKSFSVEPPQAGLFDQEDTIKALTVDFELEQGLVAVFATTEDDCTLEEAVLVMKLDDHVDPYSDKADKIVFKELFQRDVTMEITDHALELLALLQDD